MVGGGLLQDYALRNSMLTLIAGFAVGGILESAGLPDPGPTVAVFVTWAVIPAAAFVAAVKGW